jgi:hypothetical protein
VKSIAVTRGAKKRITESKNRPLPEEHRRFSRSTHDPDKTVRISHSHPQRSSSADRPGEPERRHFSRPGGQLWGSCNIRPPIASQALDRPGGLSAAQRRSHLNPEAYPRAYPAYMTHADRATKYRSHSSGGRYGPAALGMECISWSYIALASSYYARSPTRKSCCLYQMASEVSVQTQPDLSPQAGPFYALPPAVDADKEET